MDLGKSQAQWNAFFKILGAEIQTLDLIESWWARAQKLRSGVTIQQDQQGIYTSIDLAGQANIGTNTDEDGFLYGKFIAAGPTTELYKDSARTQLVATGTTAASATTVLTEQNSSGFTAVSVVRPAGAPADDSDWKIDVSQDLKKLLSDVYANVLDASQDQAETDSKAKLQTRVADALATMYTNRRSDFVDKVLQNFIAEFVKATATDRAAGSGFTYTYDTTSVSGQRLISGRQGIFAELRQAMADQSAPAGAQSVKAGTPTAGNLVAVAGNRGKLKNEGVAASTAISLVLAQNAKAGTMRLRCTSDVVGLARFSVENLLTTPQIVVPINQTLKTAILANGAAEILDRMQDGPTGFDFTLLHKDPVESGDDGAILSATAIALPNATDTDFGKVYVKITRTKKNPPDATDEFEIELFSNSGRTTEIGSQIVTTIVGSAAISITTSRGMIFTSTFDRAAANVKLPAIGNTDSDIEFDIQVPRTGDQWTVAITEDVQSRIQRFVGNNFVGELPSSGTPTIVESYSKFHPTLAP